ncbi:MAG TPA: glutathione S-transferase family protein, partial [Aquabacterium sp.]|uniref:glutathione S-transferase family protein n=1 Tax=Aquabacterium sp. TaxID=1872578 RepID=UPI002E2F7281
MLSLLKLPHEVINVAGAKGEHKSPEFLAMNPFGQVPVLVDGDKVLRDSQAILFYLASQYGQGQWVPADPQEGARVVSWLTVAASEVSRGPGALRLHHLFGRPLDVPAAEKLSAELLAVLNDHLSHGEWLVGHQISIADLAMYSYIAL